MALITRYDKEYTRKHCREDKRSLFIFTDNTNRTSGYYPIDENSDYAKRFGKHLCYPSVTTALIRGLDNACPITTQKFYKRGSDYKQNRWNDEDFDIFKEVIDNDFEYIIEKWNTNKYYQIVFPPHGIFNSKISNISKERTPKLYEYLQNRCKELFFI